jgi:FKBP-type peptidyl-prolyl cis-trans isomerase
MKRLLFAVVLSLSVAACGHKGPRAQAAPAADASFLASNAKAPGVITLPSGLQYKIVHSGPATR